MARLPNLLPATPPAPPEFWEVTARLEQRYGAGPTAPRLPAEPLESVVRHILAQQSAAAAARAQFEALRRAYPAWEMALLDGPDGIEATLRGAGGGLSRVKAGYIFGLLEALGQLTLPGQAAGELSLRGLYRLESAQVRAQLEALPGIGPTTAALVMLFGLGLPALPLEGGILRVLRRLEWSVQSVPKTERWLLGVVGADWQKLSNVHVAYIRHARQTCTARPRCAQCVVRAYCPSAALFEAQAVE